MNLGSFCWILGFILQVIAEESYLELYDEVNYGGEKYVLHETDNHTGDTDFVSD